MRRQPAQRIGRHGAADLCAADRRQRGDRGDLRHDPGQANGSYVYTLTTPFDTSPDADNGANTEVAESFTYVVTDANGNTATGTITVNIVDDVPTAQADSNSVIEGAIVTGNVLTGGDRRRVRGGRCDGAGRRRLRGSRGGQRH